jgi:glyoxylase-like metal-dependent hydrolase (beta-lactamase superfamily II)
VIVERALHPQFLSNTYLVADGEGGPAFFVDAGGPVAPLIEAAEREGLEPTHVLLTHHHFDHVSEVGALRDRWPQLEVFISPLERDLLAGSSEGDGEGPGAGVSTIDAGGALRFGALEVRPLRTPGHTAGMLSFLVNDSDVFTGDTLFKGSVGGVRAPGSTTFEDLKHSIMDVLMKLRPEVTVRPGHTDPSTIGDEWENNAFIRVWRGLDAEGDEACTVAGEPATLVLWAPDYDGGHKAWVRWEDGRDDIVPGSRVERG